MTLRQHEPSAQAPCTKMMVEFGGNSLVFEACEFVAAWAVFCAFANLREPSSTAPRDAAVSAPRNLRRSISLLVTITFCPEMSTRHSSLSCSFCFQPAEAIRGEEVFHRGGNF